MSDGRREVMGGTYFSDKKLIPTDDPQTGELNPYYKELTGKNNPLDIKHMPNQKWHRIISFLKSGIRILGYAFMPFNLVAPTIILIISEIVGIIEELV